MYKCMRDVNFVVLQLTCNLYDFLTIKILIEILTYANWWVGYMWIVMYVSHMQINDDGKFDLTAVQ